MNLLIEIAILVVSVLTALVVGGAFDMPPLVMLVMMFLFAWVLSRVKNRQPALARLPTSPPPIPTTPPRFPPAPNATLQTIVFEVPKGDAAQSQVSTGRRITMYAIGGAFVIGIAQELGGKLFERIWEPLVSFLVRALGLT